VVGVDVVGDGDGAGLAGAAGDAVAGAADDSAAAAAADRAKDDGPSLLLAAGVAFSAGLTKAAEDPESAEWAVSVVSAGFWSGRQPLSPELIACRLPCRSLGLPIVSAGSGTAVLGPAAGLRSVTLSVAPSAVSALAAGAVDTVSASVGAAVSVGSTEASVSPEEGELPLAPAGRRDAAGRELPVLVRDDDMMPLSRIVSVASPSGSVFRLGGAMMSGG
jgi:hypothetical protein